MTGHISTLPAPRAPAFVTHFPVRSKLLSQPLAAALTLGLLVCIWTAVLAFGATLPLAWSAVQIVLFALLGVLLWGNGGTNPVLPFPWKAPATLLLFVALQSAFVHPSPYRVDREFLNLLALTCAFCVSAAVARIPS